MRSRAAYMACALVLHWPTMGRQSRQSTYRTALPGYSYEFPRDYFNHPEFQTEWWYYTGNLRAADGHRFGFELTFFRQAVDRDTGKERRWDVRDLYLAHLALSDLDGGAFYHDERVNRAGPGIAGISEADRRIWNGNWSVDWQGDDQKLRATNGTFELEFALHPEKRPVIHGENGVSQKAAGAGRASHYVSLTRLDTKGRIQLGGKNFEVAGLAWMDHEFFTHQLEADQVGWDWLSLQLDDKTELMLFRIRRKDGSVDRFSAGTFVNANGGQTHLRAGDFTLTPQGDVWKSPRTQASYPIRWKISVPKLEIEVEAGTPLASQEITSDSKVGPNYWEGAIRVSGRKGEGALSGNGYLEMTGYDRPFEIGE
jgi:predicted secreted hydrolase